MSHSKLPLWWSGSQPVRASIQSCQKSEVATPALDISSAEQSLAPRFVFGRALPGSPEARIRMRPVCPFHLYLNRAGAVPCAVCFAVVLTA